ncbi:carbohydrate kinase [Crenobacter sp. SG2305]|uniref:carbohydrate kinase family protein n=1 Tax=Crenobacter oryzisoli TaxID=3056844 RepID=UPI0025AB5162|nr:carbohydrate kinase [Crenobacter sp. SG2305]MDN0083227.1 carbohydrate kinase [Crenobacter sp. SG2305]
MMNSLPVFVSAGEALSDMIRTGANTWQSKVGGAPWNVARIMASWGVPSGFAGAVSLDCFGEELAACSRSAGLDTRFLQQVDAPPLLAMVHKVHPPEYFFIGENSADLHFAPEALPSGWMECVRWVHMGGISLARPPLSNKLLEMAHALKASGVCISYDPNFRTVMDERYDFVFQEMTKLADVIKVSDEDLHGLFRHHDAAAGLATLRTWNPEAMVLYTLGAKGAHLYTAQAAAFMAPPSIEVIDTVGAGDVSIGGLLFSLQHHAGRTLEEHLAFSVASGAAACLQAGANVPDMKVVERLFASLIQESVEGPDNQVQIVV